MGMSEDAATVAKLLDIFGVVTTMSAAQAGVTRLSGAIAELQSNGRQIVHIPKTSLRFGVCSRFDEYRLKTSEVAEVTHE